jgi:hypothetical protein
VVAASALVRTASRTAGPGEHPLGPAVVRAALLTTVEDQQRGIWYRPGGANPVSWTNSAPDERKGRASLPAPSLSICSQPQLPALASAGVLPGHQAWVVSSSRLRVRSVSTGMPGPMVVEKTTFLRYLPLAEDGLARSTSSSAAP